MPKRTDDLTKIKGLGRGSQRLLNQAGISTYRQLAQCSVARIQRALAPGGRRYASFDVSRWASEARQLDQHSDGGNRPEDSPRRNDQRDLATNPTPSVPVIVSSLDGGQWTPGTPFRIERLLTHAEAEQEYFTRQQELDGQFKRARRAIRSLLAEWRATDTAIEYEPGEPPERQIARLIQNNTITAATARYRSKLGHPVSPLEVVISINVDRKRKLSELDSQDVLPREYESIRIKVVEGRFQFINSDTARSLRGRCQPAAPISLDDPVVGGVPIAPENVRCDFGTLGFALFIAEKLIGLTCHHVVKSKHSTIVQLGTSRSWRKFAEVLQTIPAIDRDGSHEKPLAESVDCAIVSMKTFQDEHPVVNPPPHLIWARGLSHDADAQPNADAVRRIYLADTPLTPTNTRPHYFPLFKFGSGTGERLEGRVGDISYDSVWITGDEGTFEFKNNFTVCRENDPGRSFVTRGDSGSIVALKASVDGEESFVAIGILFAALTDDTIGLACSMPSVIRALNLRQRIGDDSLFADSWLALDSE